MVLFSCVICHLMNEEVTGLVSCDMYIFASVLFSLHTFMKTESVYFWCENRLV